MNQLLNVREVCEILQVSDATIRRLVGSKELKAYKVGGQLRFKPDELEKFLQRNSN